jgi:hypothetical protein
MGTVTPNMNASGGNAPVSGFIVESYDNFDSPSERCCKHEGVFNTVDAALACARGIVDRSLTSIRKPNQSPGDWYKAYELFGDGVYAYGIGFNPYIYAKERIRAITGLPVDGV